ncbi:hypothetical protein Syun_006025 [Stephania yunnanensis]|uniref:Uncharacterized protein n=1 Tax=Stephania yunnanensis TaxID=152371 RepID=A0AAP0PYY0_9MAGN
MSFGLLISFALPPSLCNLCFCFSSRNKLLIMAEELIVGGAGEIVKRAISLAFDEVGLVIGVKGEVKKLKDVLTHIQSVLQDAEEKQVKEKRVKVWLQQLKQVSYDAEDALDEIAYNELKYTTGRLNNNKLSGWLNYPLRLVARFKMAHQIKAINLELYHINERKNDFQLKSNNVAEPAQMFNARETYSFVDESTVIGRDIEKKEITQMLINDDVGSSSNSSSNNTDHQEIITAHHNIALPVMVIVGLGGLGKTTLAQSVYNNDAVKNHFRLKVWICVSTNFETTNLFFQILQQINPNITKLQSSSVEVLLKDLESQLKGNKILLLLDDVWNEDDEMWEKFISPLRSFSAKGSKILVTSRSQQVASAARAQTTYQLRGLSDDACWGLIERRAFVPGGQVKRTTQLVEIGKEISKKCKGVPLAAKVLGGMLQSKKEVHEWSAVRDAGFWNSTSDDAKQIMEVLRLSYDNLPSKLKPCFSYCAIFPKDYWIWKESLIQLWMAQGLLGASNNSQEEIMEDTGNTYFNTLYSKSFFQEAEMNEYGEVIGCKMHDLVNDLAQSICKFECQNFVESNNTVDFSKCRHASFISPKTLKVLNKAKKVRTIFGWESHSDGEEFDDGGMVGATNISSFFKFKLLRVLDLSGFRGSDFSSSLGDLKHLRYLDLSFTSIKSLPKWVTRLYHLQTLKLIECPELVELPEDLINLKKLRHLFIDDGKKWQKMPQAMGKLDELQTLPVFGACQENGISVLEKLNNLRGTLEIRRLGLVREASLAKRANVLSKKSKLRKLELYWDRYSSIGDEGGSDLHVLEELQPHPNLHELFIKGFKGVEFPRWMSNGSLLPNLKSMKISNCSNCEHIPSLGELSCLEMLEITYMRNLKSIGGSKDGQMDTTTTPQSSSYSCLKVLELGRMPNLEEWFEGNEVCFQELSIKNCPNLRTTPHSFSSLKSLTLENVGGMGVVSITSSLTSLTSLSIGRCKDLKFLPEGLLTNNDQLIIFNVEKCPKLQAFKEKGLMVSNSNSLRELKIRDCDALKSISDLRGLTSLQKLEIQSCEGLKMIPKGFWSSFVALESLNVFGCKRLKGIIKLSPSLKHLRQVQIEKCPNLKRFDICNGIFSCCHTLKIQYCNAISSIDVRSFASLRELNITKCRGLHALQGLPFLTAIEKLSIGGFSRALHYFSTLISEDDGDDAVEFNNLLPSLRELEIIGWPALRALPHHLQYLTTLNSLSILRFNCLTELPEWIGNLASLKELQIMSCANLRHLPSNEQIQGLTFLRKLYIGRCSNFQSIKQPVLPWCHTFLHELQLWFCDGVTSIDLGSFVSLRILNVCFCSGVQALQGLPFPWCHTSLQQLRIWKCDGVTSIDLGSFVSLRELNITKCSGLHALQGLLFLTALKDLELGPFSEDSECFPSLLGGDYDDDNGDEVASNTPLLPSLRGLHINGWPALRALPHHLQHLTMLKSLIIEDFTNLTELPEWIGNLASLAKLQITRCTNLTHLPSKEQMQRLTFLKCWWITDSPRLKKRCRRDGPEWPKISHIPHLDM